MVCGCTLHFSHLGENDTVAIERKLVAKESYFDVYKKSATNLIHIPQIFIS